MRIAYKDRPITYRQIEEGFWCAFDERLGLGAVARTREEAYDKATHLILERLQAMSDEEFEAHLDGCEIFYVNEHGNEIPGPEEAEAASS